MQGFFNVFFKTLVIWNSYLQSKEEAETHGERPSILGFATENDVLVGAGLAAARILESSQLCLSLDLLNCKFTDSTRLPDVLVLVGVDVTHSIWSRGNLEHSRQRNMVARFPLFRIQRENDGQELALEGRGESHSAQPGSSSRKTQCTWTLGGVF